MLGMYRIGNRIQHSGKQAGALRPPLASRRWLSIVLVCLMLASGSGCQVLGIPSYRADAPTGFSSVGSDTGFHAGQLASSPAACPPGILPPKPTWLCQKPAWLQKLCDKHHKEDLPEAPEYPRFHPLPTRPMFAPRPQPQGIAQQPNTTILLPEGMIPEGTILEDGSFLQSGAFPPAGEAVDAGVAGPAYTQPAYEFGRVQVRTASRAGS